MRVLQGIFFLGNILKGTEKFLKVPRSGTFKNFLWVSWQRKALYNQGLFLTFRNIVLGIV
jgi:hypothetical protein